MRFLSFLTTFLTAALLASCGGGGGSPGVSSGSVQVFSVAAPSALTLQVGLTQQYVIQGGVKPYAVFSSNPAVAVGWLIGENVVGVGTSAAGLSTVTVLDAKGSKFDIAVTAGSSTAFFTTAPPTLTLAPGPLAAQTFKLGGGTPPYKAVSQFPTVVSVVVNGNDVTITALQVSGSPLVFPTAIVTMTDSSATLVPIITTVTLGSIPMAVTPTAMTVFVGDAIRGVVTGGTPPYRVLSGIDEAILSGKIVNGNQVEAVGGQVAEGAPLTIIDANSVAVTITVKIVNAQDSLRIQPNVLSFPESATTPDITIIAYGASATGGIQVFTSDSTILKPLTPVKTSDGTGYAITLTGGNTCSLPVQAAVAGVDNSIPLNGNFTDPGDVAPVLATGGDRTVTITVLDAKGKLGTSVITVKDANGKAGC